MRAAVRKSPANVAASAALDPSSIGGNEEHAGRLFETVLPLEHDALSSPIRREDQVIIEDSFEASALSTISRQATK